MLTVQFVLPAQTYDIYRKTYWSKSPRLSITTDFKTYFKQRILNKEILRPIVL